MGQSGPQPLSPWSFVTYTLFPARGGSLPECIRYQSPLTLEHVLLNYVYFMTLHQQFYIARHNLFTNEKQEEILPFLREAGLYYSLLNHLLWERVRRWCHGAT